MKCISGKCYGKGSYTCCKCGTIQALEANDDILKACSICGNNEFDVQLNFERSNEGHKNKLNEVIRILEVSYFLCKILKIRSFYNVIAIQLRILLCDNTRIIQSKVKKPMLHPHSDKISIGSGDLEFILSNDLFDKTKERIPLNKWLKQEIAWSKDWGTMNIKDVIKAWANKNGGAHVDSIIPEKEFFAIHVVGEYYLIEITQYIIELLGYDLEKDVFEYVMKPYSNLLKS